MPSYAGRRQQAMVQPARAFRRGPPLRSGRHDRPSPRSGRVGHGQRPSSVETQHLSRCGPWSATRCDTAAGRAAAWPTRRLPSVKAQATTTGLVELVGAEPVRPGLLVVLGGEVPGAGAGGEGLPYVGGVLLVAGAPGRGRDVHDVAPALLVLHGGSRVDAAAGPSRGDPGLHVGDPGERLD